MANAPVVAPLPDSAPALTEAVRAKAAALGSNPERCGVLANSCTLPPVQQELLNSRFAAFRAKVPVKKRSGRTETEDILVKFCLACGWETRAHAPSRLLAHLLDVSASPATETTGPANQVIKEVLGKGLRTTLCSSPVSDDIVRDLAKAGVTLALEAVKAKFGEDEAIALSMPGLVPAAGKWTPEFTKDHNARLQELHVILVTVMFGSFNSLSCDVVRYVMKEFSGGRYVAPSKKTAMRLFHQLTQDTMDKVVKTLQNPAEPIAITFDGATGRNGEQFHNVCATVTSAATGLNTKFVLDVKDFAWRTKTADRLAEHVWQCVAPFARNVCSTAPDTAAACMKAQRILHTTHEAEFRLCEDLPCTTHIGNLLVKDAHEAWGPDHKVPLRDGRRVAVYWNKCKRAKCLLQRAMEGSKKSGVLKSTLKLRTARNTRFCSIHAMQQSILHNHGVIRSLIWDRERGERTQRFKAVVSTSTEPRAHKMERVVLSSASVKTIERHEKILRPITQYTRLQDSDGVQIHKSALRWYTCRVAVAKELAKVSKAAQEAWEQKALQRTKGMRGTVPVLSLAAKMAFVLHPPHRSKAREHDQHPPAAGELRYNVLWDICAAAAGPYFKKFFPPAQLNAALREWVDYQGMAGQFADADLAMAQERNPLFFWAVGASGSAYLKKVAQWVYCMREQNTPSEQAHAVMGRISQPIRSRLKPSTKRACLLLAANWRTVNAPNIPMLRQADDLASQRLLAKLQETAEEGDGDASEGSDEGDACSDSDASLRSEPAEAPVDVGFESEDEVNVDGGASDFEGFGGSDSDGSRD